MTDPTLPSLRTALHDAHVALGARMVPFAGYDMPVQYADGILSEHNWTRTHAGLFDVSHMGQALLIGPSHSVVAAALETLVPADILNLKLGQQRYTQLLNSEGGIIDDLMVTRPLDPGLEGTLFLVVNAARKAVDYAHMMERLPGGIRLVPKDELALIALQGPEAAEVIAPHAPEAAALGFMSATSSTLDDVPCHISRSGYTGEDGFEISVAADAVEKVWSHLLSDARVKPIGLGARDSLRLEAGLCLYGHDIDTTTSPIEAQLAWSIQKRRREAGGFPGAARIQRELAQGPTRVRVGLKPEGRAPAREGVEILHDGAVVGQITSGGFGPTVGGPIAMGYVPPHLAEPGTALDLLVRGKPLPARVCHVPFVAPRYARKS
ncbi:MAG: glycine cleavage system aminomethyltransferase GcvT [Pseudomonadota bacterium]